MPWLVDGQFRAVRQTYCCQQAPALIRHILCYLDAFAPQVRERGVDVIAHQVELVPGRAVGGMDGELSGRQREDEPPAARVHGRQFEHVGEEAFHEAALDQARAHVSKGLPMRAELNVVGYLARKPEEDVGQ